MRKVDSSGIITSFAGIGVQGLFGDQGLATLARFNGPQRGYAYTLGVHKFQNIPNIPNMRGTIEFDTPLSGAAEIGALGIRIPARL